MSDPNEATDVQAPEVLPEGPGNLFPSLFVTALILVVGVVMFGFPGGWAATALIPGFILGTTGAHLFRAVRKVHPLRPGVLALGLFLGGVGAFVALALFAAANAPIDKVIKRTALIDAPPEIIWDYVGRADQRVGWVLLFSEVESIGRGDLEEVGSAFRVRLNIDGALADGEHVITAYEAFLWVAWSVKFPAGVKVEDFTETVELSDNAGKTEVSYTIRYRVPSVIGRLFDRMRVRGMFDEAARMSVEALATKATE